MIGMFAAAIVRRMTDDPTHSRKLAVLIDADSASLAIAVRLFEQIAKIGEAGA